MSRFALLIVLITSAACSSAPFSLRGSQSFGGADFEGQATGGDVAFTPGGELIATMTLQGPVRVGDAVIDGGAGITRARDVNRPFGAMARIAAEDDAVRWAQPAMNACAGVDLQASITVDPDAGDVYLASARLRIPYAICLSRYTGDGKHLWSRELFGAFDIPRIAALRDGHGVILAGRYAPEYFLDEELDAARLGALPPPSEELNMVARFDSGGALVWLRVTEARVKAVVASDGDAIFVASDITEPTASLGGDAPLEVSPQTGRALVLTRYDANGAHIWSRSIDPGVPHDLPLFLDASPEGELAFAGYFQDTLDMGSHSLSGDGRIFAARLGPDGAVRWVRDVNGLQRVYGAVLYEGGVAVVGDPPDDPTSRRCKRLVLQHLDAADGEPRRERVIRACVDLEEDSDIEAQVVLNLDGMRATDSGELALIGTFSGALYFDSEEEKPAHVTAQREGTTLGAVDGAEMAGFYFVPIESFPTLELAWSAFVAVYGGH